METLRNNPYVKQYDENGEMVNRIVGIYEHDLPNRKERRKPKQKFRFIGNGKSSPTKVIATARFRKRLQVVKFIDKKTKEAKTHRIEHYDPA